MQEEDFSDFSKRFSTVSFMPVGKSLAALIKKATVTQVPFAQGADIMSWSEPRVEPGWLSTLLLSVGAAVGVGLPLFIVIVWMFLAR
jgi:hypothetical protein